MTHKRKAELQRKLSMAPVAKPPLGLSDRIKADIPDYLNAERDRERLSQSVAFSLRVAASIVLLVTSVFLTVQLLWRDQVRTPLEIAEPAPLPQAASPARVEEADYRTPDAVKPPLAAAKVETRVAEATPPRPQMRQDTPSRGVERRAAAPAVAGGAVGRAFSDLEGGVQDSVASATPPPPPAAPSADARDEAASVAEATTVAPAAAEPSARGFARLQKQAADRAPVNTSAPVIREQQKASLAFGISTDPNAFARLKEMIERGEQPSVSDADVAALVNHFAGPSAGRRRDLELRVEASRAPLATSDRSVIRYTIDSGVATRAKLSIEVNDKAVASYRVLSGAGAGQSEASLGPGDSVTGLIELRLAPNTRRWHQVAKITLEYAMPGRRPVKEERSIRVEDLNRKWTSASRRHRLATLGAVWGESLRRSEPPPDIARTASELAEESPGDERARELAAAASASARPRNSGPTGSED